MSSTSAAPVLPLESVRHLRLFESRDEKSLLVHQLEVLLDKCYVHLALKEHMLGVKPVQQVRLLQENLERYPDDPSFLAALLRLVTGLRDLHTLIHLPEPWSRFTAFLPFQLQEYFDASGVARYLVKELAPGVDLGGDFIRGVEVTHWNGEPMAHEVHRLAETTVGANHPARRRLALEALTRRALKYSPPPDEDFVLLTYLGKKGPTHLELPWLVRDVSPGGQQARPDSRGVTALGANEQSSLAPDRVRCADSLFPESLSFRSVETPSGRWGYLRIINFQVGDVEGFVREVERIVRMLPETGLLIDVRGNQGGSIPASERLLQLFTPSRIEPVPFSFRCTDFTRELSESSERWSPWRPSLQRGVVTGELFSQGFALTPVEQANSVGRIYKGPVVLLCDALSYSAAELFIAGFKDHHIGKILGVDTLTGAGGSSLYWHQQFVRDGLHEPGSPLKPLPCGVAMHVALLRSTRVGPKRGTPLEGTGVECDFSYRYTRDDVLHGDVDLLNRAGQLLAGGG